VSARVVPEMPEAEYHRRTLGEVSSSALRELAKSPAHYRAWLDRPERAPSAAMALGSMVHQLVLEPQRASFVVEPDFGDCRKKENKAARDAWRADHEGATLVGADDAAAASGMASAVRAHPLAGPLVVGEGQSELSLFWRDGASGLECKARLDRLVGGRYVVVDLKTTGDARPRAFQKSIADFRYHVQAAHYLDGCRACGLGDLLWLFVVVEREPPHAVAVYSLDGDAVARGEDSRRRSMTTLAECLRSDSWPAYPASIEPIGLPAWAQE